MKFKFYNFLVVFMLFFVYSLNALSDSYNKTFSYGSSDWSLTNYNDKSSYYQVPSGDNPSVASFTGIFTGKTITSDVVVTINCATYGTGTDPDASTFSIYSNESCTSDVSATQGGTLPTSSSYTNVTYTISSSNASYFSDDLYLKITKPGKTIRLKSVKIVFTYTSGTVESHTANFHVNGGSSSEEFDEGDAIVFPEVSEIDDYTFIGWTTSPITGTRNDAPTLVDSPNMGSSDVDYYAVFASVSDDKTEHLSQTLQYDSWTYSGSTTDKSSYSYRLFHTGSYVESAPFDLSTLTKVVVYGGTYGGTSYNKITIGDDNTNTWKQGTVSGTSQTGVNTYTDGSPLSGVAPLRVYSNSGSNSGSGSGVRISKIEIFTNLNYGNYWTTQPASKIVESISVKTEPTTTTYAEGDKLDLSGLVLTVTYEGGSTEEIATGFTASPSNGATLTTSDTKVTFTYNGKTCEQDISVLSLTSISVTTPPTKTTYIEGESLDLAGVVIDGLYGSTVHREISGWTASPANGATLSTSDTKVTFTYNGQTCEQLITVNPIPTHNVTWSVNGEESSSSYKEGESIVFTDPASGLIPEGYEFVGWYGSTIDGEQTTAPVYVTSATMGTSDVTYYAVLRKNSAGEDEYSFTITGNSFNGTSYAANDGSHEFTATNEAGTETMTVNVVSSYVMKGSTSKIQFKASTGILYNTTPLGNIKSIEVSPSSSLTCYYGESVQPTSSSPVGGSFFRIKNGSSVSTVESITVTFIPVSYSYCTSVNVTPHLTWDDDKETVTLFNNGEVCKSQTATASNDATVTYSISDDNADIDKDGSVYVTAAGDYTVTASAPDMESITYTLHVIEPVINISGYYASPDNKYYFSPDNNIAHFTGNGVSVEALCLDPEFDTTLDASSIDIEITKNCQINITIYDEYGNSYGEDFNIEYHEPQNYNVIWMVNGEQEDSESVLEGTKVTNPTVEDIPGYVFTGWVTSPIVGSLDSEPDFFSGVMPAEDITLYAVFATVKNADENEMTSVTSTLSTGVYYILGRDKDYDTSSHNYYAVTGNVANKKLLATNVTDAVTENDDNTISLDISNDVVDNSNMRYLVTVDGNDVELKMVGANSPILLRTGTSTELTNQAGIGWEYSHPDSDEKTFYIKAKNTTRGLFIRENAVIKGYAWGNRGRIENDEVIYNDAKFYFLRGGVLSGYRTEIETRELVEIEIKKEPKILYTVDSTFDPSGLVLTGTYEDIYGERTTEDIVYDEDLFTFTPSLSTKYNTTGSQEVTITYKEKSTTLTITVVNPGTILAKSVVGGSYNVQVASETPVEVTTKDKEISATQDALITLTATPYTGYKVSSNLFKVYANTTVDSNPVQISLPLNKVDENTYTFTMPAEDAVEIVTTFQQLFTITSPDGSITAVVDKEGTSITEASLGTKVVLTPSDGNELVYYVRGDDQLRVYVSKDAKEEYSFSMPARDITVYSTTGNGAGDYAVSENVLTFHKNNPTAAELSTAISDNNSNVINLSLINIASTVVNDLSGQLSGTNKMIYTVASSARPNVVVVKGNISGEVRTCANFVLTDLVDFGPYDKDFTAAKTSYTRGNTAGYNSVCLPFAINYSEVTDVFGDDAQISSFTGVETVDGRATSLVFLPFDGGTINAGSPVLVNNAQGTDSWNVELKSDRKVALTPVTTPGISSALNGAYVKRTIGSGFYKLNSTGEYFLKTGASSVVSPFRFYLSVENAQSAPQQLPMFRLGDDEETGIRILSEENKSDKVYDLSGRTVGKVVAPGLYIVNGKKMLMK